jgi:hypothetical protein
MLDRVDPGAVDIEFEGVGGDLNAHKAHSWVGTGGKTRK